MKTPIKDFYGRILGYVNTDQDGNKVVTDFYERKLGSYDARQNVTKDFYNRIIAKGDVCVSLIFSNSNK